MIYNRQIFNIKENTRREAIYHQELLEVDCENVATQEFNNIEIELSSFNYDIFNTTQEVIING